MSPLLLNILLKKKKTPWIKGSHIYRCVIHTSPVCGKDSWGHGLPQFLLPPPRPLPPAARSILRTKESKEAETPGAPRGDGSCSLSPYEAPMSQQLNQSRCRHKTAWVLLGAREPWALILLNMLPGVSAPPSPSLSSSAHPIHSPYPGPQLPRC